MVKMHSILASVNQLPTGTPISTVGTDENYVELYMRRLGVGIELTAVAIQYCCYTGRYLRDELAVEIAEDESAIDTAVDLQHIAHIFLDAHGYGRGYCSPCAFGEAVEKALDAAERQDEADVPERAGVIWPVAAE
jgi:hypothetical protein